MQTTKAALPRDNLVRAISPGYTLRTAGDGAMPTLTGHFAVFNQWAEIDSLWEGNFLERILPGAFRKTFKENRDQMRVLFQHGMDPQVGDKPLGPIEMLAEDKTGAAYEVPLLDTAYNREILPGLQAGLYGASFRFKVLREDFDNEPDPSVYNPKGLPERSIREMQVKEFGPVTFPAYQGATAGVRSLAVPFAASRELFRSRDGLAFSVARMDVEDLDTLANMVALAADYIDEQDEPEDQANVPRMQAVIATLVSLMAGEVTEPDETGEPEDENGRSEPEDPADEQRAKDEDAPPRDGAALERTPSTDAAATEPIYGLRGREEVPSWRL